MTIQIKDMTVPREIDMSAVQGGVRKSGGDPIDYLQLDLGGTTAPTSTDPPPLLFYGIWGAVYG